MEEYDNSTKKGRFTEPLDPLKDFKDLDHMKILAMIGMSCCKLT